ncbi:hypothetical protein PXD04_10255 [Methanosphaera sp. ISO3-F5]|uniref:hypothetical protein n=1 Tax=Methanosphaera sp. ISO3-F5 TaxID=1452353 RepID=UPI002B25A2A9|nr:hypothetical protein [Methanosphaera sp. ISO3-F5]WQH64072.1 hypothetical protein PXD04_10255 [Methanosphaera sp. ISO3-F5]
MMNNKYTTLKEFYNESECRTNYEQFKIGNIVYKPNTNETEIIKKINQFCKEYENNHPDKTQKIFVNRITKEIKKQTPELKDYKNYITFKLNTEYGYNINNLHYYIENDVIYKEVFKNI